MTPWATISQGFHIGPASYADAFAREIRQRADDREPCSRVAVEQRTVRLCVLKPAVARRQELAADAAAIPFGSLPVQTLLARWGRFADEATDAPHPSYRERTRHLTQEAGCPLPVWADEPSLRKPV